MLVSGNDGSLKQIASGTSEVIGEIQMEDIGSSPLAAELERITTVRSMILLFTS